MCRGHLANLLFDDSRWFGTFALHPHLLCLYNFEGVTVVSRSDVWYFEDGIAPSVMLLKGLSYPVTVTAPVTLGLGDAHFYPEERFG